MRFTQAIFASAALFSTAFAQLAFTSWPESVEVGETYEITYTPNITATIILRKGESTNLDILGEIGTGENGVFSWTPESDLVNGEDYALEITAEGQTPNYSGQFPLSGGSDEETTSSSSSSSASATETATETATITSTLVTASASSTISYSGNSTQPTLSGSRTLSPSSTSTNNPDSPPESTGAASVLSSSPLALVFGAVAAMAYLG